MALEEKLKDIKQPHDGGAQDVVGHAVRAQRKARRDGEHAGR